MSNLVWTISCTVHERVNPYATGNYFDQYKIDAKTLKNFWNPGKWVLIWEYSARAVKWVPTWQGLDVFQK